MNIFREKDSINISKVVTTSGIYFAVMQQEVPTKRTTHKSVRWSVSFLFLYATIYCFHVHLRLRLTQTKDLQSRENKITDHFRSVIPGRSDVFVFSAFGIYSDSDDFSQSDNVTVSVISVVDMDSPVRDYKCILRRKEPPTAIWTKATLQLYPESHGRRFTAAAFSCMVKEAIVLDTVSLVADNRDEPSNVLPIMFPSEAKRTFTVCVPPLNSKYSKAYQLVDMMEVGRLLGADHYFFYNYSTEWNVDVVLNHYKSRGLATIIQWPLPLALQINGTDGTSEEARLHYFGQLVMLNDCLNRNRGSSKYVIFQDLDELLIPKNHQSWNDMMNSLPANMAAYMFRSSFFHLDWPDSDSELKVVKEIAKPYKAYTFIKQYREERIFGRFVRSKYIVDPFQVQVVGVHNVWIFRKGGKSYHVPPEVALVHHYRAMKHERQIRHHRDNSTLRFIGALYQIQKTWRSLPHIPLGPIN